MKYTKFICLALMFQMVVLLSSCSRPSNEGAEKSIINYEEDINLKMYKVDKIEIIDIKKKDDLFLVRAQVRRIYKKSGRVQSDDIHEYPFRELKGEWKLYPGFSGKYY